MSENILHHHSKGIDELIAAVDQSLELVLLLSSLLSGVRAASG